MKEDDPNPVLHDLARKHRGKLSRCQVFDANVCTNQTPPDRPWELTPVSGQPFTTCLRFRYGNRKVEAFANQRYLAVSIHAELPFDPLSINGQNRNDPVQEFSADAKLGSRRYPVFTRNRKLSQEQRHLVQLDEFAEFLDILQLQDKESLHVTRGDISVYLHARPSAHVDLILDRAAKLLNKIEVAPPRFDWKQLPEDFRPLAPLMEKWAQSDDGDRDALVDDANRSELENLVSRVEPFFDSINRYLNSFGEQPLDESAIALGNLAEAAHEAKLRLQR